MKRDSGSRKLSVMMLLFGLAALALRTGLYAAAVDARGLLLRGHPLTIALAVLSAAVLTIAALSTRKIKATGVYEDHYRADLPSALGCAAAGAGILATVLAGTPVTGSYLEKIWLFLGLASPVCLLLAAAARVLGKRPFFLLHVVVCLFFVLHIVTRYQFWSSQPQMQDYLFSLLGAMALMFFGFYKASLEAGLGDLRMTLGTGLAAIYLCIGELARSSCPLLYLGGILWVLTDLFSIRNVFSHEEK